VENEKPVELPELLWPVDWEEIKATLRGWITEL